MKKHVCTFNMQSILFVLLTCLQKQMTHYETAQKLNELNLLPPYKGKWGANRIRDLIKRIRNSERYGTPYKEALDAAIANGAFSTTFAQPLIKG